MSSSDEVGRGCGQAADRRVRREQGSAGRFAIVPYAADPIGADHESSLGQAQNAFQLVRSKKCSLSLTIRPFLTSKVMQQSVARRGLEGVCLLPVALPWAASRGERDAIARRKANLQPADLMWTLVYSGGAAMESVR